MALARVFYILVSLGLLLQIGLALISVGFLSGYPEFTYYWCTLPHLILLPLTLMTVVINATYRTNTAFVGSLICLSLLLSTWFFANLLWPGGDDGLGLAWLFGPGFMSILNTGFGIPLIYLANRNRLRNSAGHGLIMS